MRRLARSPVFLVAIMTTISGVAAPQASDPASAPLRAGDRLLVKVWLDTTLADTVRIDETGTSILPRLGPLVVVGLSPSDIADSVRRAYSRVIRTPAIEVTALRRITVLGEVRKPATYFMETRSTLRDAIALAGGVTDIGTIGHIAVIRDSVRTVVSDWERRGDAPVIIRSGDVIVVDREAWLKRNIFSVVSGLGVLFSVVYTATR